MIKKAIFSLVLSLSLAISSVSFADECTEEKTGHACVEGKKTTAAIAWTSLGISLLIAVGVIVAITINNNNSHSCKNCH